MAGCSHDYLLLLQTGQLQLQLIHTWQSLQRAILALVVWLFEQQIEDVCKSAYVRPRTNSFTHTHLAIYQDYLVTDHDHLLLLLQDGQHN